MHGYLLMLKHISWSWKVSGPESTLSHRPLSLCNSTSTAESRTLPCNRYSWFGTILFFMAEVKLSVAGIGMGTSWKPRSNSIVISNPNNYSTTVLARNSYLYGFHCARLLLELPSYSRELRTVWWETVESWDQQSFIFLSQMLLIFKIKKIL